MATGTAMALAVREPVTAVPHRTLAARTERANMAAVDFALHTAWVLST